MINQIINPKDTRRPIVAKNNNGEVLEFDSVKDAGAYFHCAPATISHHRITCKPFKGYTFELKPKKND